ncbi:hypothetical protein V8G54_029476 [Vigna mungo]|uniref:Uncharacterized protein n=1 Tax=Vigna mungo TaxID=3915 RepID=A0AAQ3MUA1_VIGMU
MASLPLPKYKHCPSDSNTTLSNIWYTRLEGWCTDVITLLPFFASDPSVTTRRCAAVESRPEVGSSSISSEGSTSISCAMLTRFRSPPETPRMKLFPIIVCSHFLSPSSAMADSAAATLAARDSVRGRRSIAQNTSVSRTVRWG